MSVHNLLQVMQAQGLLMNELATLECNVLAAVLEKDAAAVQRLNARRETLSAHLVQAEEVRVALIRKLALEHAIVLKADQSDDAAEVLARLTARLSDSDRSSLATALRRFKIALQQLVTMNQCLQSYTEAQMITLDSFMGELFPQRKQGVYGADGRQSTSARPQLVKMHA